MHEELLLQLVLLLLEDLCGGDLLLELGLAVEWHRLVHLRRGLAEVREWGLAIPAHHLTVLAIVAEVHHVGVVGAVRR